MIKAIIESLLFVSSEPISVEKISEIVDEKDKKEIRTKISELQMEYETTGRAIAILEIAGGFQMVTRPQYAEYIKKLYKSKIIARLSRPALETISIISYKQPITRLEIESIRGVNSGAVIQTLLERKLIKIRGRKEGLGRPLLYGTTSEFLQYFGLKDLTEMPKIEEIPDLVSEDTVIKGKEEMVKNGNSKQEEVSADSPEGSS